LVCNFLSSFSLTLTKANLMKTLRSTVFVTLMIVMAAACQKEDKSHSTQPTDFRDNFVGSYTGQYHSFFMTPQIIGSGQIVMIENDDYKQVIIEVTPESDSTVTIQASSTGFSKSFSMKLTGANRGFIESKTGGSGYWYKELIFRNDSLLYSDFAKCGIPCSRGFDIAARKTL
ncbi:MAG: hypothetical protein ACPF9D_04035, partial [Owenweeksia sp.]